MFKRIGDKYNFGRNCAAYKLNYWREKVELIRHEDIGEARIIVADNDGLRAIEEKHGLSPMPGAVLDFVITDSGLVLVISDRLILDDVAEELGGRFATSDEIGIEADSWIFPLVATNLFNRSQRLEDADSVQKLAGQYLEAHVRFEAMGLWQRGLVLATVKTNWERLKALGLEEGESFWGWARKHASNNDSDDAEWDRTQKRFYSYMRAADLMLRNTEDREWIGRLTMKEITDIPISKVGRCCGLIGEGVFDVSPDLRTALFDSTVNNNDMNVFIRKARAHQDEIPEQIVDKETGEISYIDRQTREEVDTPTDGIIDEYLPDIGLFDEPVEAPKGGPVWTYDWERKTFGFYLDGEWTPGLSVVNDNHIVGDFVDLIIANCHVRADYEGGT